MNDPNFHRGQQLIYKINFDPTEQAVRTGLLELLHYHTGNTTAIAEYILVLQARAGIPAMPAMQPVVQQNGQMAYQQVPQYQQPAPMPQPMPQPMPAPMPQAYPQQVPQQAPQMAPQPYPAPAPDPTQPPPNVDQPYMGQPTNLRNPIVGGAPAGSDDGGRTLDNSIDPALLNRTQFADGPMPDPAPQPGESAQNFKQGDIPLGDVPANPAAPQPTQIPNYDLWRRDDMNQAAEVRKIRVVSHMKDSTLARKLREHDMNKLPLAERIRLQQST